MSSQDINIEMEIEKNFAPRVIGCAFFKTLFLRLLQIILISHWTPAFADVPLDYAKLVNTRGPRIHFWSFDMGLDHYAFLAPDESKIEGVGGSFALGYGRIRDNSWALVRYHFLSGPWDSARNQTFDVDSSGSTIDFEYGRSAPGYALRSGSGPFWAVSGGYLAFSSKNIGANRKSSGNPNDTANFYLEQDFKTTVNAVVLTPSIGWNWVKSARPAGNEPELLLTRVESSYLRLGAVIPLYSRTRVKVIKRSPTETLSQSPTLHTTTGIMRGYSIVMTAGVWLGI